MKTSREPPIVVVRDDLDKLKALATVESPVADYLANELERAQVVDSPADAAAVVRLGSKVRFTESANGDGRELTLVMPNEADIDAGRISILTPVGAALLGLSAGQGITFTLPNGSERALNVLDVANA